LPAADGLGQPSSLANPSLPESSAEPSEAAPEAQPDANSDVDELGQPSSLANPFSRSRTDSTCSL